MNYRVRPYLSKNKPTKRERERESFGYLLTSYLLPKELYEASVVIPEINLR